jgi:hypothetical protein
MRAAGAGCETPGKKRGMRKEGKSTNFCMFLIYLVFTSSAFLA